jgi:NUMOD3 motif
MPDFIKNKYTKWYFNIVSSAQNRDVLGYTEQHHIIPKSLGGSNRKENLVKLTAREHFICHWLLTKMVSETKQKYQMWNAFSCMLYRENSGQARYKITGRVFENIKKEGAKIKSIKFSGIHNPMYGVSRSQESKKKQSNSAKGRIVLDSTREKLRKNMLGKSKTESHRNSLKQSWAKNRESRSGKNHSGYGKPLDENIKEKIRQGVLNMPLHTCEHCGKITTKGNYKRWHSDNCKSILGVA